MTDILDEADGLIELQKELSVAAAQKAANEMPEGTQGDCELCGIFIS